MLPGRAASTSGCIRAFGPGVICGHEQLSCQHMPGADCSLLCQAMQLQDAHLPASCNNNHSSELKATL